MRPAVGGEDGGPTAADCPDGKERIAIDGRQKPRLRAEHGAVVAEKARPLLEAGHDGMVGVDNGRQHPFRPLAAIVTAVQADREDALDRRAAVVGLALDALEGEIAANHQESATALDEG